MIKLSKTVHPQLVVPMQLFEAQILIKLIELGLQHEDTSRDERQCAAWMVDRIKHIIQPPNGSPPLVQDQAPGRVSNPFE